MNGFNLIMPMAGGGTRFKDERFALPKPLIEIYGKPFFYWSAQSVLKYAHAETLTFAVLAEHEEKYGICSRIKDYYPQARFVIIPQVLNGAVLTCLEAIKAIDNDLPVIFNDCDHMFRSEEFNSFTSSGSCGFDGALLTFKSDSPKFSFIRYNDKNEIIGTVEKQAVSRDAICGTYTVRSRPLFEECAARYLESCNYSEYFMSGVYNVMLDRGYNVKSFQTDYHISFGTPEEYDEALGKKEYFDI